MDNRAAPARDDARQGRTSPTVPLLHGAGGIRTLVFPLSRWGFARATTRNPGGRNRRTHAAAPREWRRRASNPLLLVASEVLCHQSLIPRRRRRTASMPT